MNVSERDKKLLLILIPIVVVIGYWFLLLAPKQQAASDAAATLEAEQATLANAESNASTVETAKANFARDYAAVVALGKAIPTSVDMPSLLVQLEQAAGGTGIEFDGVTVGERTPASESPAAAAVAAPAMPGAPNPAAPQSAPGDAAATAQQAADTASTPPPTASPTGTATPTDPAAAGAAPPASALEAVPLEFEFSGDFFELADFFHRLKRFVYVDGENVRVRGRLLTIDAVEYTTEPENFPALKAKVKATVFLTPKAVGATAGATPAGPQPPAAAPAPVETAGGSTPPTPTAATTP